MKKNGFRQGVFLTILVLFEIFATKAWPAGLLSPRDGSLPDLAMKEHHVSVAVEDGYVVTTIDQVFENPHGRDLEALYTFPVPEDASVAEFSLWIDGKKVPGEVLEKQRAKTIYQEEKAAGRETGLTEKNERNSFEIFVYPVRANDTARLRLVYIQPASVDTGMGRYLYPLESGGVDELQDSFWTANERVEERFSFRFKLRSSVPVDAIRVPNFPDASVNRMNDNEYEVVIDPNGQSRGIRVQHHGATPEEEIAYAENEGANAYSQIQEPTNAAATAAFTLDKDIVVYWRQAANVPARVDMVAYKPDPQKTGTFMITVTPGDDLRRIEGGRDWVFILDQSGSMGGKFSTLLEGVEKALGAMTGLDRFRIVFFANSAAEFTNGFVPATVPNIQGAIDKLKRERTGGGTNLYEGMEKGLRMCDPDRTTSLVLVTDGVANVGITDQAKFVQLMEKKDIRLFTFMMGNSANTFLLKHLTDVSNGFAVSVSNADDIVGHILSATGKVNHEALHGVSFSVDGVRTRDLTANHSASLYRGHQYIVFGHYENGGQGRISLEAKISGTPKTYSTTIEFPDRSEDHPEIERLWAYAKIQEIMRDMVFETNTRESERAIVDLGRQYGIVTDYTSMLVVREEVFAQRGIQRTNQQRLTVEEMARQSRATAPVRDTRVDSSKPMYSSNQASHRSSERRSGGRSGGGGSLQIWFTLFLLPLLWKKKSRKSGR